LKLIQEAAASSTAAVHSTAADILTWCPCSGQAAGGNLRSSVAKGPKFLPQTSIGAVKKCEGPKILAAEFFLDSQNKGRKGAELFQDSWLRGNLGIFRDEHIFNPTLCLYSLTIF
jgi:hypothetical protein